jgi:hypothetical protein
MARTIRRRRDQAFAIGRDAGPAVTGDREISPLLMALLVTTPKVVRKARRALHPVDNIVYGAERQVITSLRPGRKRRKSRAPVYRHGSCRVAHRSPGAAAKCGNR